MGMDGVHILQQAAKRRKWQLHTIEHFHVPADPSFTNATRELLRIKEKQSRIVILKCPIKYVTMVMKQAEQMDMIQDWVWILTNLDQDMVCFPCCALVVASCCSHMSCHSETRLSNLPQVLIWGPCGFGILLAQIRP